MNLTYTDENDYLIPILRCFDEHIPDYPKTEVKVRVLGYLPIPKDW